MALTTEEARVLASLMEAESVAPDRYPLTVNSLRLACNQTDGRKPVVAYDDRTVETALLSLTSMGLVRSVAGTDEDTEIRYRHAASDRWRLGGDEVAVLATLVLGGSQTVADIGLRLDRQYVGNRPIRVGEVLDTLSARSPEPLAGRLPPRGDGGEPRWAHRLSGGSVEEEEVAEDEEVVTAAAATPQPSSVSALDGEVARLTAEVADLQGRVAHIEKLIGLSFDSDDDEDDNP
jgi:uncharacterized protein YceH (UPF0502 family)